MALITCPECTKIISDQAFICPHCGYPLNPQMKNLLLKVVRTVTQIARNIFSFTISLVVLIISIGVLTYFTIKVFDYFSQTYLK